ncbi:MAG: hypothetical protein AAF721_29390, partial [Myxococcota bacterium]
RIGMKPGGPATYDARLDARLDAVMASGARTFGSVLAAMLGADPLAVAEQLRRRDVALDFAVSPWRPVRWRPQLHPAHAEWYFNRECAGALAERFAGQSLLCLGAPTVAAAAGGTAVDRDPALLRSRFGAQLTAVVACDLGQTDAIPVPAGFDAVVIDPPWYAPHPLRWLALGAAAVRPGGIVAMVVPGALHRPTAELERHAVVTAAAALGPTRVEPQAVHYDTPGFEALALRAASLAVPAVWRAADLVVTEVMRPAAVMVPPPVEVGAPAESIVIGEQLVTLSSRERAGSPRLAPLPGTRDFRWDRISRRDPRVDDIDVWTSGSRVASVYGRPEVRRALLAIAAGAPPTEATDHPELAGALSSLLDQSG